MTEEIEELERQVRNLHDLLARQKLSYEAEIKLEVAAERERCAKIAELCHPQDWAFIGSAIRNQGNGL